VCDGNILHGSCRFGSWNVGSITEESGEVVADPGKVKSEGVLCTGDTMKGSKNKG